MSTPLFLLAIDVATIVCAMLLGARVLASQLRSRNALLIALIAFDMSCGVLLGRQEYGYWIPPEFRVDVGGWGHSPERTSLRSGSLENGAGLACEAKSICQHPSGYLRPGHTVAIAAGAGVAAFAAGEGGAFISAGVGVAAGAGAVFIKVAGGGRRRNRGVPCLFVLMANTSA